MIRDKAFSTADLIYSLSGDDHALADTALFLYETIFKASLESCKTRGKRRVTNLFLSYIDIRELFDKNDLEMKYFSNSLKILCNPDVHILHLKYVFIDEFDNRIDISAEDVQEADENGSLAHPKTGDLIYNYKKYIFPFFVPSKPLKEMEGDLCRK